MNGIGVPSEAGVLRGALPWSLRRRDRWCTARGGTPRSHWRRSSSPRRPPRRDTSCRTTRRPLSPTRSTASPGPTAGTSAARVAPFIVVHWSVSGSITSTTGCEPAIRVDDPNTGTTRTCTASGPGGTTSVTTKLLKVDATAPSTSVAPSRAPNGAGWYRAAVMLQWSGSDATSGIASCSQQTYSGPDTASTSQTGSCTDNAGNSSNASLTLHYDSTPPSTLAHAEPGAECERLAGSAVKVAWNGSDATVRPGARASPKSRYSGPDTAGATLSGSCTDNAGNSSTGSVHRQDTTRRADDDRRPDARPERGRLVPRAGDDLRERTDSLSGVDSCTSTTYGGPDTTGTSTERDVHRQRRQQLVGRVPRQVRRDAAGRLRARPPAGCPTANGWYNHPVRVDWHGTDATSGDRLVLVAHVRRARRRERVAHRAAAPTSPGTAAALRLRPAIRRDAADSRASTRRVPPTTTAGTTTRSRSAGAAPTPPPASTRAPRR